MEFLQLIFLFFLFFQSQTLYSNDSLTSIAQFLCIAVKTCGDAFCTPGKTLFARRLSPKLSEEERDIEVRKFEQDQCERVFACSTLACAAATCACCCSKCVCIAGTAKMTAYGATIGALVTPQIPFTHTKYTANTGYGKPSSS